MNKTIVFFNKRTEQMLFAVTVLRAENVSDMELATRAYIMSIPVLCGHDWQAIVCCAEDVKVEQRSGADSGYGSANRSSCVGNPMWN